VLGLPGMILEVGEGAFGLVGPRAWGGFSLGLELGLAGGIVRGWQRGSPVLVDLVVVGICFMVRMVVCDTEGG
jgi:hypothetical protein